MLFRSEEITARLHLPRQDLNLAALHAGRMPTGQQEVALDATFCHRRGLELSDQVELAGVSYTLVGIITLPDYTALFKTNQDPTVNALTFTVGVLSPPGWDRLTGVAGVENTNTYSLRLGADLAGDSAPGTGLDGAGHNCNIRSCNIRKSFNFSKAFHSHFQNDNFII